MLGDHKSVFDSDDIKSKISNKISKEKKLKKDQDLKNQNRDMILGRDSTKSLKLSNASNPKIPTVPTLPARIPTRSQLGD